MLWKHVFFLFVRPYVLLHPFMPGAEISILLLFWGVYLSLSLSLSLSFTQLVLTKNKKNSMEALCLRGILDYTIFKAQQFILYSVHEYS